jgi:hypothetical protein
VQERISRTQTSLMPVIELSTAKAAILLACGCGLLCLLVNGDKGFLGHATNADSLLAVSYIWDVRNHDYAWLGFELPRIPSIFPDLVTYAALDFMFGNFRWVVFTYSILQCLTFIALAGHLISKATSGRAVDAALVFLVIVSVIILTNLQTARPGLVFTMFLPVEHFSSFIMSLVGAALALSLIEKWRPSRAAFLTVCVLLAYLSNRKFLIDFIVPFCAAMLVLIYLRLLSWRHAARLLICVAIGVVLARYADRFLTHQPHLRIGHALTHIRLFLAEVPDYLRSTAVAASVSLLVPYVVFAALFFIWLRGRWIDSPIRTDKVFVCTPTDTAPIFLWVFAAVAITCCLAALSAVYVDFGSFRYAAPAMFWPLIFLAAAVMPVTRKWVAPLSFGYLAAVPIIIGTMNGMAGFSPLILQWQNPLAACLLAKRDDLGLKSGLSEYWLSRPTTISTNWSIQVDQITENGNPYYWGNDKFWYLKSFADPQRPPEYNFIVITMLDPNRLRERFGPPSRTATCDTDTLWIYDDPATLYRKLNPLSK